MLVQQKTQDIPGSVRYVISRYRKTSTWILEDSAQLLYRVHRGQSRANYLELRYCISGNQYCGNRQKPGNTLCSRTPGSCKDCMETVDVFCFRYEALHLQQFLKGRKPGHMPADSILDFRHPASFAKELPLCGRTRTVLESILQQPYSGSLENIYINAQLQMVLLYSLDCMVGERDIDGFQCRFLANEADREKITLARNLLLQHIGEPLTIKELSRKVAINECYLKKGFKEMFGTTIFDFYQSQRMEHARYLLYEKGATVTDVSALLGYSSISHFSTAFKKHTGLKPCSLLLAGLKQA